VTPAHRTIVTAPALQHLRDAQSASYGATAPLHTSDGEPDVALGLFEQAIDAFHRAGNVPQLIITLASAPALFERLDRLEAAAVLTSALSREPSSLHHVPELAELADRVAARPGATRMAELTKARPTSTSTPPPVTPADGSPSRAASPARGPAMPGRAA
jgi:hypothetical protein